MFACLLPLDKYRQSERVGPAAKLLLISLENTAACITPVLAVFVLSRNVYSSEDRKMLRESCSYRPASCPVIRVEESPRPRRKYRRPKYRPML